MTERRPVATVEIFDIYLEGTKFRVYKDDKPFSPDSFDSVEGARNWCKRNIKQTFKPFSVVTRVSDYNARSYIGEVKITNVYFGPYNSLKLHLECDRPDGRHHSDIKDNFYFLFEANENNLKICRRILGIWDERNRLSEEENRLERELTSQLRKDDILRLGGIIPRSSGKEVES